MEEQLVAGKAGSKAHWSAAMLAAWKVAKLAAAWAEV
jgi:hypothetical protein